MMTVLAKATCRCCTIEMHFLSKERAKRALDQVGLKESAVIVDDEGRRHEFVNTFEDVVVDRLAA